MYHDNMRSLAGDNGGAFVRGDDAGRVEQHPWAAGVETETYHEKGISESEHEAESEMKNVLTIGVSMRIILGIILFAMGIAIACSTFMKYTEYPFCSCARFLAGEPVKFFL